MQADTDLKIRTLPGAGRILPMLMLLGALVAPSVQGATIVAGSCSLNDVQAAVNAANNGDIVKIPGGSCSWSGGISTSKQIRVEAQSYSPTKNGSMARSVTITNNAGTTPLIEMTSGNSFHVGVGGIRFNHGSGSGNYLRFSGSGTKVPLVYDCAFQIPKQGGNAPTNYKIAVMTQGGVFWNLYFDGLGDPNQINMAPIWTDHPRAWTSASTMGQLDSGGTVNFYLEDSTAKDVDALVDVDRKGRAVIRSNVLDGTWLLTHGFTSGTYNGGRHVEIYDNTFRVTTPSRNMSGRYFWLRAGTVVVTGNSAARAIDTSYAGGNVSLLVIGDNTAPSGADGPMHPGWGHNGVSDVLDPIYVWANTGPMGSAVHFNDQSGNWSNVTRIGVELFIDSGPKPGWSRFTYPHPARLTVESGIANPMSPVNVTVN